ncbi:MAG: hypothetical protein E7318_13850 [Clostridiales bacterium]|nr:hypothetical protein [Clostridiales bacterium]
MEPRESGFFLGKMIAVFCTPDRRWYLSARLAEGMRAVIAYMQRHQRPDGCFDLTPCNYASPPDTAFMINGLLNGWWILEKCTAPEADFLREPVYQLIDSASRGIAAGGFHTPNHRWAISSCLLCCEKITGNKALGERAREYLREGLDINEDGEFAERSSGGYNMVNDDQMIRLYLATGDQTYLEAAAKNLEMMYCYYDPDASVFTNNSTRQDLGTKVYGDGYYDLYLMVGWFLKRPDLGAMAEWIWQDARRRGTMPHCAEWLLLFPEMDGYGADSPFMRPFEHVDRLFPDSDIARNLKKRNANRIFAAVTFPLFTNGLELYNKAYEEGLIDGVISTNLTYRTPELQAAPWFIEADMSKYISYIIATLNHDRSLSKLLSPSDRIAALKERYEQEQVANGIKLV